MFNNIKYDIYNVSNETIHMNSIKSFMIELIGLCDSNIDLVNNILWKANVKNKYISKINEIKNTVNELDEDLKLLEYTISIVDKIKVIEEQIKTIKNQIESMSANPNVTEIFTLQEQLNELNELKHNYEKDLYNRWSI